MGDEMGEKEVTFNEFVSKLKLQYTFGVRRTDGASRRYSDQEMGVGSELHTDFDEKTHQWGEGKRYFYLEDSDKTYTTLEELFPEWLEKHKRLQAKSAQQNNQKLNLESE